MTTDDALQCWCAEAGVQLQFVPTMGGLHRGHGALIQTAAEAGPVLVSVFVNPLQFGPAEDYGCYPRTLSADLRLAQRYGASALWAPSEESIYPAGQDTARRSAPTDLQKHLCGAGRPGHFDGVVTVVARLLEQVKPSCLWLGEKDWQQLVILRRLVADLNLPVQVRGVPTQRDIDGLALSSRNAYLSNDERDQAAALPAVLRQADPVQPLPQILKGLAAAGLEVEYVERVDPLTLQPCGAEKAISLLAAAVRCGTTRLIDHVFLMTRQPLVAIDGPAGAGKSTVTRAFAERLGLIYLDTGAMYRSVTWWVQKNGVDPADAAAIEPLLSQFELQLQSQPGAGQQVLVNGVDVSAAIRSPEVTASVSAVAAHRCVRQALTTQQKAMGAKGGLVAEGRDIGTAVFPDADLKVFLTATVAERARRRALDLEQRGFAVPERADLEAQIAERDHLDSTREEAPLIQADDAVELVTDGMAIEAVVDALVSAFRSRIAEEAWPTPAG
ncbi:MAG: bifunctional pantoate--beta-alanine ligase/(d)CMP kinase [Synechococcus sp.]|nr:bifunctional pantoate--beta-alanine ligase/(d)CMP kinase [Synechococcus sp.]